LTPYELTVDRRDEIVVVELSGEVDASNVRDVRGELSEIVPTEVAGLMVDLAGVRYMDSAAVSMLFELIRSLETTRQRLALVVPEPSPLRRLLEVTGLVDAAIVCATEAECLSSLQEWVEGGFR